VFPLRRRHERSANSSTVAILAATDVRELFTMHKVAAKDDVERAAFFAASRQRRRCDDADKWGVSDPHLSPPRLRPRALTRGSLTPQPSFRFCHRRCPSPVIPVRPLCREETFLPVRQVATGFWRPSMRAAITHPSIELCSAPCKARRFRSAHARVRAWPSGLDGACAQLAGRQLRDGLPCVSTGIQTMRVSGNRPQVDTPPVGRRRPSLEQRRDTHGE
jgi:hypothetical protein